MAQKKVEILPLDPYLYMDQGRLLSGPARTADVVLDEYYGPNGRVEFASKLWVGTAGDVSFQKWDGNTQVLKNMQAGIWHNVYSTKINTTGTTATGLVWGS